MWGTAHHFVEKKMSFLPFGLSTVAPADRNVGFGLPWSCKKQLKQEKPASSSSYEMRVRSASSTPPPAFFFFFFTMQNKRQNPWPSAGAVLVYRGPSASPFPPAGACACADDVDLSLNGKTAPTCPGPRGRGAEVEDGAVCV